MIGFSRADDSLLANWWWTVDRWLLTAILILLVAGLILTFGASMPVAERLHLPAFFFAKRQTLFLVASLLVMLLVSLQSIKTIRRGAMLLLIGSLLLMLVTLVAGPEYKGATRWIQLGSFTLQPSEFLKPALIVTCAWLFAGAMENRDFPGRSIAGGLFALSALFLVLQPDIGQTVLLFLVFGMQIILAGLPVIWMGGLLVASAGLAFLAYLFVPHVTDRIDRFLDPSSGDSYQVDTALNAFRAGGLFGRGPGEGSVKKVLPDAHTDYIFAVAGEEFGALACLAILAIFAVIVIRTLLRLTENEEDPFVLLAASGLMALFGLQAMINIAVNLALIPAKGMTLPFISYGGSSMLALGLSMGMVLAMTRKNRFVGRSRAKTGRRA